MADEPKHDLHSLYRSQIHDVDLSKLKDRFRGTRYKDLIQEHVRKTGYEKIVMAIRGHVLAFDPQEAEVSGLLIDEYNERGYERDFWRRDTAEVLEEICEKFKRLLEERGCSANEKIQFNQFQLVTLNFAQMALEQKELRRFMGIRKGVLFT